MAGLPFSHQLAALLCLIYSVLPDTEPAAADSCPCFPLRSDVNTFIHNFLCVSFVSVYLEEVLQLVWLLSLQLLNDLTLGSQSKPMHD